MDTKTELKDVVHLYTGCTASFYSDPEKNNFETTGEIISVDLKWQHGLRNPWPIRALCKRVNGVHEYKVENFFHWDYCIIHLRPFSDMTIEESSEIFEETVGDDGMFTPTEFIKLLDAGFDLFDLIESGQAIDKTKI